jgi:hypothetical protein
MAKPKYILSATDKNGRSISEPDRSLGTVGGVGVFDDKDLTDRLKHLPEGVTAHVRRATE